MTLRLAEPADALEDLYHAVRELAADGMPATSIIKYVRVALRGDVPAPIRDRLEGAEN
jgi:hypothetical protein